MRTLILGGTGLLGRALCAEALSRKHETLKAARSHAEIILDISDQSALKEVLGATNPDLVINAAANINLAKCEANPDRAHAVNAAPAQILADWSLRQSRPFVQISTDHFFEGDGRAKHDEHAPVTILNQYASSKKTAEDFALQAKLSLIVRTNIVGFHPDGRGFATWAMDGIINSRPMILFDDFYCSSLDIITFSIALFDLIEKETYGIINLASREVSSKQEFVMSLAGAANIKLNWAQTGSAKRLQPPRARSLGLDVGLAERLLERRLPDLSEVCETLVKCWKQNL